MGEIKIGDIVARKSYGEDIYFKVVDILNTGEEKTVILKGIMYRIEADAPESDLIQVPDQKVREYTVKENYAVTRKCREISARSFRRYPKKALYRGTPNDDSRMYSKSGKVLHIDGDEDYLDTCLKQYKEFGIETVGKHVPEKDQPSAVYDLLKEHRPDILVLTGHDGFIKSEGKPTDVNGYWNSKYYIEAVKQARKFDSNMDNLIIFAGACQSMYKEIINAGANFASSPNRVLIHALDPVFVCQKIAFSNVNSVLDPMEVVGNTITGAEGIGGLQTRGKSRKGYPTEPQS
ncbi:sporulation peptidase YabG [Clostridium thermosuccinogenes]|jgi:spore coat assembly protein|uniref:Sporulation peptidase YabG n=1 Tax=Clostridium thermosuccinogenes TaxID=84032 RepID=A0A2K2FE72_9CLOT|nr:sporulation peptidase YabG [Pseudoclostridium thermosuccinogenes]AUS98469.1 sporulation peptidase YabG [Pseudoclostridium thermosuccinogenes]PNT97078.1 sporulation peptidase YabG [Pseudoclostridium thermosuccinogenes]PNT99009.1 sporulation peptidase YabG [Pseudoclostridium thermosuccinogenes]